MAEKQEKKADAAPPADKAGHDAGKKKGGFLTKTPVLITGVMVLEAAVLFAGFKMLGGGAKPADGAELADTEHEVEGEHGEPGKAKTDKKQVVEIPVVVNFTALNTVSGRKLRVDVEIVAVTKSEFEERLQETFKSREALIKDRIRTIIAQSDPEKLGGGAEPGLETLRRQIKYQLDEIAGEGVIQEVLVPRCIPIRVEF